MFAKTMVGLICCLIIFCPYAAASDKMYRWVDDKGVTHFSYKKPESQVSSSVETVKIRSTSSYKSRSELAKQDDSNPTDEYAEINRKNCAIAKQNIKILTAFANVGQTSQDGTETKLSAQEKQQQLDLANKQAELFCK